MEDFKKWLCEKAGMNYNEWQRNLEYFTTKITLLIKAMWAINRENIWQVINYPDSIDVYYGYKNSIMPEDKEFLFKNYNSEQETLMHALKYIFDKELENEKD